MTIPPSLFRHPGESRDDVLWGFISFQAIALLTLSELTLQGNRLKAMNHLLWQFRPLFSVIPAKAGMTCYVAPYLFKRLPWTRLKKPKALVFKRLSAYIELPGEGLNR